MKMPRKVIISCLTLLSAFTLAASVSGTLAWYQYHTRATVEYTGVSINSTKLLQLSVDNGTTWDADIKNSQLPSASFAPVTTGAQEKDAPLWTKRKTVTTVDDNGVSSTHETSSLFYAQPNRGQGLYENWFLATDSSYAQFSLLIKINDIDGNASEVNLSNEVYITDLTIEDANADDNLDLDNAVRVHISTEYKDEGQAKTKNFLFAKDVEETEVGGFLDLDENGELDQIGYEWDRHTCVYGGGDLVENRQDEQGNKLPDECINIPYQHSYKSNDPSIIASTLEGSGTSIGKTGTDGDYMKITVTIWLEGWSILSKGAAGYTNTSIWDEDSYIEKDFNVGLTFGVRQSEGN